MPERTATRPSFLKRLTWTLGSVLGLALGVLGVLVWLGLYVWLTVDAFEVVDAEMDAMGQMVVAPDGSLDPSRYTWNEPHHRYTGRHIDPYFVQVFDARGRLVRQSDNISFLGAPDYPDRVLPSAETPVLPRLRTFSVDGMTFYYLTRTLRDDAGDVVGYLQVAREEPGIEALMTRMAWVLFIGLVITLLVLLLLVRWQAGRVLRPLAALTSATQTISAADLKARLPVLPEADAEAAQLATTLNAQLDQLERAFGELARFTSNAAHELQTPLTVLRGHVDIALRRPRSPEAYRATLRVVRDEVDALSRMVRSLLTLTRLDREARLLDRRPLDLGVLAREEAQRLPARAEAKGLRLNVTTDPDTQVAGQPDLLREVVRNVLDNALKYTEAGHIDVRVHRDGDHVRLRVTDTGVGMTAADVKRATDRFFRAARAEALDVPGSGLGLALVAEIVAAHDGRLELASQPETGTTVEITLPAAPAPVRSRGAAAVS